jgi:hypothetical protein
MAGQNRRTARRGALDFLSAKAGAQSRVDHRLKAEEDGSATTMLL